MRQFHIELNCAPYRSESSRVSEAMLGFTLKRSVQRNLEKNGSSASDAAPAAKTTKKEEEIDTSDARFVALTARLSLANAHKVAMAMAAAVVTYTVPRDSLVITSIKAAMLEYNKESSAARSKGTAGGMPPPHLFAWEKVLESCIEVCKDATVPAVLDARKVLQDFTALSQKSEDPMMFNADTVTICRVSKCHKSDIAKIELALTPTDTNHALKVSAAIQVIMIAGFKAVKKYGIAPKTHLERQLLALPKKRNIVSDNPERNSW
eukprot:TRINITY_DN34802_c0_g4_i1.p2 TRINITY_DN34802_c0_g4~~TRINITY_DN34802_c0_g4_i1.p2  ORF type:complete len:264 (-),score=66.61 TRINITY_DN34802_c0_g4_i1:798-1589(-)